MKFLFVDSHKGTPKPPVNLHFQNAQRIAENLRWEGYEVDLIWSYPTVNNEIKEGYDVIVFNHASHYSFVDFAWVQKSPWAKLFFITNEYNLGEPRAVWNAVKREGRTYEVIANHDSNISKVVTKYTSAWHNLNLNCLVLGNTNTTITPSNKLGGVYYGSFRKNRAKYFQKYLNGLTVSTHSKNREKFLELGIQPTFINRIPWDKDGLNPFAASLYIEDEITHSSYNYLANRFYEALNYNVVPLFGEECVNTIQKSDYAIHSDYIVKDEKDFAQKSCHLPSDYKLALEIWKEQAFEEKKETLEKIQSILTSL